MLKLTAIAIAAATLATGAGAQTAATKPVAKPTSKMTTAKTTMATHTTTKTSTTRPAMVTNSGKMATTTTKTGKKITYDCSKKGNMNKTACKK